MINQPQAHDLGKLINAALAGRVSHLVLETQNTHDGRHVDDHTALSLLDHLLSGCLATKKYTLQIDSDHTVPIRFSYIQKLGFVIDTGVGNHNIQPAKVLYRLFDQLLNLIALTDITLNKQRFMTPG